MQGFRNGALMVESTLHVTYVIFHILLLQMHARAWDYAFRGFHVIWVLGHGHARLI